MRCLVALVIVGLAAVTPAGALGAQNEGWITLTKWFKTTQRGDVSVVSASPQGPFYQDCGTDCGAGRVFVYQWDATPPTVTLSSADQSGWQLQSWTSDQIVGDPCEGHPGGAGTCQVTPVAGAPSTERRIHANYRDAGAPTAGALTGLSSTAVYRGTVSGITATGSDAQTSIAATQLVADGVPVGSPGANPHSYTTPGGMGTVQLRGRVFDESDNQADGPSTSLSYDNVAPAAAITSPAEGEERPAGDMTIEFTAADANGVSVACAMDTAPFGPCTSASRHVVSAPALGTHTFHLRAMDGPGNTTELSRSFKVIPVAPVTVTVAIPAAPVLGSTAPQEVPATVKSQWSVRGRSTRIVKLAVRKVPVGGRVQARCRGRGCPLRRRAFRVRNGNATLTPAFKHARLGAGATLEVRVTATGFIGKVVRYRFRAGRLPSARVLCLPTGAKKPQAC